MRTLGIRVEPTKIWFSIFCSEDSSILNIDKIIVPEILIVPEQLKLIRHNIIDIIREYDVRLAGIKMFEGNAQKVSIERLFIEGVIQESFASSSLESYSIFRLASLACKFELNSKELKGMIENGEDVNGIELSQLTSKAERESVLVSIGVTL